MEVEKIEAVIVGGETEIRSEPVIAPTHSYHRDDLKCLQCLITFSNLKAKERHFKTNHPEEYAQHLQQLNTVFSCFKCNKCFFNSEKLNQHQVTHSTEKKPFRCSDCKKSFSGFSEVRKHQRFECSKRRFICIDCGALFPSLIRLHNHQIAKHPKHPAVTKQVKTFRCRCSCSFQTEEKLLQHLEVCASSKCNQKHSDSPATTERVKIFRCFNCRCDFWTKEELLQHQGDCSKFSKCIYKRPGRKFGHKLPHKVQVRKVNDKIKEEIEQKEESSPTELEIPCPKPDCDCTFPTVAALRAHKKDKHGPPPCKASSYEYTCLTCGKNFEEECALNSHQTLHIKEEVPDDR